MINLKYVLAFLLPLSVNNLIAQRPQEIQLDDDPFDFTDPIKLLTVFIIPILLLIIGAIYIRKRRKQKKNE